MEIKKDNQQPIQFVIINGNALVKVTHKKGESFETWINGLGYNSSQYQTAIRGYMTEKYVAFYQGNNLDYCNILNRDYIHSVIVWYFNNFGHFPAVCYNGFMENESDGSLRPIEEFSPNPYRAGISVCQIKSL